MRSIRLFSIRLWPQAASAARALVVGAILAGGLTSGCVRLITAPIREERKEKAEAALARLASFTAEQIAGFVDRRMESSLSLTPGQVVAVQAIDLKYARELHDTAASADDLRSKLRALRDQDTAKEAELKVVLAPDQFAKYLDLKEQMKEALRNWTGS